MCELLPLPKRGGRIVSESGTGQGYIVSPKWGVCRATRGTADGAKAQRPSAPALRPSYSALIRLQSDLGARRRLGLVEDDINFARHPSHSVMRFQGSTLLPTRGWW